MEKQVYTDTPKHFATHSHENFFTELKYIAQESDNSNQHTHLQQHEFAELSHHAPLLQTLEDLIENSNPEQVLALSEYFTKLQNKLAYTAKQYEFNTDDHSQEQILEFQENAEQLYQSLQELHDKLLQNINEAEFNNLESFEDNSQDFLEKVLNKHEEKHETRKELHQQIIEQAHNKNTEHTNFSLASNETFTRFHSDTYTPEHIKKGATILSKAFKGIDFWGFTGSIAALNNDNFEHSAQNKEENQNSIDDLDIAAKKEDFLHIINNLEDLVAQGLIFKDANAEETGLNTETVNYFGNSEKISGFLKIEINGIKKIIDFEIFCEDENCGITQIESTEQELVLLENNNEKLQFVGKEGLRDIYVLSLFAELNNDDIQHFSDGDVKAKDLARLDKLSRLGFSILEGLLEAIEITTEKYKQNPEQNENLLKLIEKNTETITHLKDEFADFQTLTNSGNAHSTNTNFTSFFRNLDSHKKRLGRDYSSITRIHKADDLLEVQENIEDANNPFAEEFEAVKSGQEGKVLHYFALKRLIENFLEPIYEKMDEKLAELERKEQLSEHEEEQKKHFNNVLQSYKQHSTNKTNWAPILKVA